MPATRRVLGPAEVVRLRKLGFTVNLTNPSPPGTDTITYGGSTQPSGLATGILAKYVKGGRWTATRLRKMGIWSTA